ncbi:uncharacterized protein LY89DRAFT_488809 [Mollisia scopiformis]|uniref:Zn(2)-C6 fungal-type domain-containing protein n=1 Tax=Mollisia scopiformis TaxID=149040 RepID=A0A194XGT7_MOLSC|nr:uncharacterized protein LY89DRAFT_488809 [Mollisia scopiformis]KUJ19344.1 hypothetical protein LY89DRAFT_488809 [Mollisia scopiformis]
MNRRSRKGCIDCKKAKVKCDEVRPACGTCFRRGYVCQGYANPPLKDPSKEADHEPQSGPIRRRDRDSRRSVRRRSDARECHSSGSDSEAEKSFSAVSTPTSSVSKRRLSIISRSSVGCSSPYPLCRGLPLIPPSAIQSSDQPGIETYFSRHPSELVISSEFADEMNSNVLRVFHEDPATVAETLSAIGHIYLGEGGMSIVPVLDRRARILAKLRETTELEQMLVMHLGLCAIELIDARTQPADLGLPALISNAAIIIKHSFESGGEFSSIAKYFIRALARQDMMISLTYARQPLISSQAWLENDFYRQADRFMGYTGPLMPILADLGSLAEEIRGANSPTTPFICQDEDMWTENALVFGYSQNQSIYQKAMDIRTQLDQWRPVTAQNVSFHSSKNLLFHAHAHKAAAILYLHRLLEPPGSSEEADRTALSLAHEVLMHLSAMTGQLKTALWPALIAGTELVNEDDRNLITRMFDDIHQQRRTITSLRTKIFCVNRVWTARDLGLHWSWMDLVHQYPGECLPI